METLFCVNAICAALLFPFWIVGWYLSERRDEFWAGNTLPGRIASVVTVIMVVVSVLLAFFLPAVVETLSFYDSGILLYKSLILYVVSLFMGACFGLAGEALFVPNWQKKFWHWITFR